MPEAHRGTERRCPKAAGTRCAVLTPLAASVLLVVLVAAWSSASGLNEEQIYVLWGKAAKQFEAKHPPLSRASPDSIWVQRVGSRIVEAWPDRRWVSHAFVVVRDRTLGAWSFPLSSVSHKVYVTTGLLEFIRGRGGARRDDLLAGVLGHEIAHLLRDHHLLRLDRAQRLGLEVQRELAKWPPTVLGEWFQDDESDADRYGAFYAMHAGFGFDGTLDFLGLLLRTYGDDRMPSPGGSAVQGVHPALSARVSQLSEEGAKIKSAIRLFQCGLDLLRVGAWEAARTCFARVRNTFMLSPTVVHNLAYAELRQYEAALAAGPPMVQCVSTSHLAELPFKGPKTGPDRALLAEAQADFLKACSLDPHRGFAEPRVGLACVYLYEGDEDKARASLEELQTGLDDAGYLNALGVLEERAGNLEAARCSYCKALDLQANAQTGEIIRQLPRHPHPYLPALYNLAHLLELQGQKPEAARLYRLYLALEGSRSHFGMRATEGLLRCGGELPVPEPPGVVESYRGINLRSSGALVVKAALGAPEREERPGAGGPGIVLYHYPSKGVSVLLAPGPGGEPVATCIALAEPSHDPIAGVRIGDPAALVEQHLGKPRQVSSGRQEGDWWDYAPYGLALSVRDGRVERVLLGGRQ